MMVLSVIGEKAKMKKKLIYWITNKFQDIHTQKSILMKKSGYEIIFFKNFETLYERFSEKRVGIVLLGDEGNPHEVEYCIKQMTLKPEIKGVRLILSISRNDPYLINLAYNNGFRDYLEAQEIIS